MNRAMRLGTAAVKSEGARFCSSFRRSGSTFTAAAAAAVDNSHRPSIYLCFEESTESTNYVVRRLGLNHGGDDAPSELTVEAYMKFEHVTARYQNRNCTMLGSQIIIPACYSNQGCREICWTDTAKTPMKFQVSSEVSFRSIDELKHQIKIGDVKYISLPTPMPEVTIGVIGGELYCLDLYNKQLFKMYPSMNEVLDPYFNRFVSLPSRSRLVSTCHEEVADYRSGLTYPGGWRTAIFFPESKKILADSDHGMYLFDAGNPKSGWREVNYTCNLYERCRLDKAFVIHNYHPDIGHFNLLFSFCVLGDNRAGVAVLFMSDACDFAHPVDHSIELPELERELAPYSHMIPDFKFVYLGAQKFGIVLNYNSTLDPCGPQDNFQVLLLTYEYDTIVNAASTEDNSRPNVDIKSRLLETRVFTYTPLEDYKRRHVDLIGAFSVQP